jgi:ectoine hydroxylase
LAIIPSTDVWSPMTHELRQQFEQDGYLIIKDVLSEDEVNFYTGAIDRLYEKSGHTGASMHMLSAISNCPELAGLIDHPRTLPFVWSILGWNCHVYHSHIDVHPQVVEQPPTRWEWHQDGGRQNRELETDPRPRLSVKLAYWFSDVSQAGRGNFTIIPGSHKTNWLPGPPKRDVAWPQPSDAIEVTANPGDVVFFDRRIWHARSTNFSPITRKGVFFGYTYRWVHIRDEVAHLPQEQWWQGLNEVQRQLLGAQGKGDGDHQWGHFPEITPLYQELKRRGLLNPEYPPLIP